MPRTLLRKLLKRSFLRTFKNFPQWQDSLRNPAIGGKFLRIFKGLFLESPLNGVRGNALRPCFLLFPHLVNPEQIEFQVALRGESEKIERCDGD